MPAGGPHTLVAGMRLFIGDTEFQAEGDDFASELGGGGEFGVVALAVVDADGVDGLGTVTNPTPL